MALLTQTVTTETTINWEELAQKIRKNESGLKVGDIITEQTKDGEELDLVVVDMGPGWARFESKDCLPAEVPYNQNGRNAGGFAESGVKWHLDNVVFTSLPEDLQAVISEIERVQGAARHTAASFSFLPSRKCSEIAAIQETTHTRRSNITKTAGTVSNAIEKAGRLTGTGWLRWRAAPRLIA